MTAVMATAMHAGWSAAKPSSAKKLLRHSRRVAVQVQLVDVAKERTRGTGTKGSRQRKKQTRLRKEIPKRFVLSKKGYQCYETTTINVGGSYRTIIPLTNVGKYVFRRQVGWQHPTLRHGQYCQSGDGNLERRRQTHLRRRQDGRRNRSVPYREHGE